jgi:hypothetical protein
LTLAPDVIQGCLRDAFPGRRFRVAEFEDFNAVQLSLGPHARLIARIELEAAIDPVHLLVLEAERLMAISDRSVRRSG